MIGKLTGLVDQVDEDHLLLDVGGVGYLVYGSGRTLAALPERGGGTSLLIETQVREDRIVLYGFADRGERDWFHLLCGLQGVGARHALAILSVLSPQDLAQAIAAQDKAAIARAQGVGPKLAARVVAELKDKAAAYGFGAVAAPPPTAGGAAPAAGADVGEDALAALAALGYRRSEAFAAVGEVRRRLGGEVALDQLIRECLRELAR